MNKKDRHIVELEAKLELMEKENSQLRESLNELSSNIELLESAHHKALEEAHSIALTAHKAQSEFLANMSHEIRTPLTAIIGFSNSLSDESLSEQDMSLATAAIIRNSHHLMNIINDILDLSKIEQQEFELEQIEFDLIALLHDVEETVSAQAIEKNLWFNVNVNFPIPQFISTDPTWIKQILLNLTSNALKFTQKGGIDINVQYLATNNNIIIDVIDTGIGIEAVQLNKIFAPFSQADTTTTRRYGGTGLGLTICANLAKQLHGALQVKSEVGKGSCFSFSFTIAPLKPNAIIHYHHQLTAVEQSEDCLFYVPSLQGHVLVAEDSIDTQNLVALYIKKTGAEVSFVNNGQQAVETALANSFDLILMDIQMPVVDGLEATKILRQIGFSKPIVAFTANAIKQELENALAAGCEEFIVKPIDQKQFYKTLSQYLVASDQPIPDTSKINMLEDEEFHEIRRNFIQRSSTLISELKQTIDVKDWSHARVLIHTFKGTCGSLGFKHLYTLSNQLEHRVNNPKERNETIISFNMQAIEQELDLQIEQYTS